MMARSRILILVVEDEKLIRWADQVASGRGEWLHRRRGPETASEAFDFLLHDDDCDLMLLDYRLPDTSGMEILEHAFEARDDPTLPWS